MINLAQDPFKNFERLLTEAAQKGIAEHNAMSLATVAPDGTPSVRIVYFKGMVRGGFAFYTNYEGQKSVEIEANNKVCVNFYWPELWQQVRITGVAEKLTRAENEAYFKTRERLSQIGAWASHQSAKIPGYDYFQEQVNRYQKQFADQAEIPCPPNWGGFRIEPQKFEFWFGTTGRLHERYCYERQANGAWTTYMLSP